MFGLDKWEYQYVQNLKDKDLVIWSDEYAEKMFPKYSHVYDKYILSKMCKVGVWDLEKELPSLYPVFCKPRKNLLGLSKGAYVANSFDEIEDHNNYIAQQMFFGIQYTTDYVLKDGKIVEGFSFITHQNYYGEIKLFSSTPFFRQEISNKVEELLDGYTGVCNVEYIDDKIIEMHLRPSVQFTDICGGLIPNLPKFIKNGTITKVPYEETYSRVFRTRFDGKPEILKLPKKPPEVRSIQLAWDKNVRLSETDPSLFRKRYLIINGTDLKMIEEFAKDIRIKINESII